MEAPSKAVKHAGGKLDTETGAETRTEEVAEDAVAEGDASDEDTSSDGSEAEEAGEEEDLEEDGWTQKQLAALQVSLLCWFVAAWSPG